MDLDSAGMKALIEEFGSKNVEDALILIASSRDSSNRHVLIKPTETMIRDILEAVHGRLAPGEVRVRL